MPPFLSPRKSRAPSPERAIEDVCLLCATVLESSTRPCAAKMDQRRQFGASTSEVTVERFFSFFVERIKAIHRCSRTRSGTIDKTSRLRAMGLMPVHNQSSISRLY